MTRCPVLRLAPLLLAAGCPITQPGPGAARSRRRGGTSLCRVRRMTARSMDCGGTRTGPTRTLSWWTARAATIGLLVCAAMPSLASEGVAYDSILLPKVRETGVPTNSLVWVENSNGEAHRWALRDPDGVNNAVHVAQVVAGRWGNLVGYAPDTPLRANTEYAILYSLADPPWGRFTTGAGPLDDMPQEPRVLFRLERPLQLSPSWLLAGPWALVYLPGVCKRYTGFLLDDHDGIAVMDLRGSGGADPRATGTSVHLWWSLGRGAGLSVGDRHGCEALDSDRVRFGVLSRSGEFSGWSPSHPAGLAPSCVAAPPGDVWGLASILMAWRRRTRGHRQGCHPRRPVGHRPLPSAPQPTRTP
jgi:hypothetical protein